MRSASAFGFGLALVLSGCADGRLPTQPDAADLAPDAAVAAASNTWAPRTPRPGVPLFGVVAAVAPNAAGHSIVYVFGGTDGEGGTGFATSAYDATTDTWGSVPSPGCAIHGFDVNGVAKIGNRMYLSGGIHLCRDEDHAPLDVRLRLRPRRTDPKSRFPLLRRAGRRGGDRRQALRPAGLLQR